ncbi:response regulator transcription factor [Sphingomonas sp.]|uniref:response regulator transcription factor n=1 Tax=Sphingomonas sp. TaxID=28214 RepID=UPI003B3B008E
MARILIVEDDPVTAEEIRSALQQAGHDVTHVCDGDKVIDIATREPFDAMTLDRVLPGTDGLTLVHCLRERGLNMPVLMISAMGEVDDRISGLRAGGDDYLVKPFAPGEMATRVEALLRRQQMYQTERPVLQAGKIQLDLIRREVEVDGEPVSLLQMEFKLLEFLMRNQGTIVTRRMLFEQVWGYRFDPGANLINVHIARLRKKIDGPDAPSAIQTIKGEGYRLDAV